jgi:3-deoxy-manno-octulosonate cytidylyltransferase (CMP-KDO synthetase)
MEVLEREKGWRYDIVVMVQGDEPMTHPEMISEAIQPLIKDQTVLVSNL